MLSAPQKKPLITEELEKCFFRLEDKSRKSKNSQFDLEPWLKAQESVQRSAPAFWISDIQGLWWKKHKDKRYCSENNNYLFIISTGALQQ